MSAIPVKTGVPDLINTKLTNSVDFHIASTNFLSILKSYANYLALVKYYDSLKYQPDPITAEATFWENFANGNLDLQEFVKNPKATKYLKKIDAELGPDQVIKTDSAGNPLVYIDAQANLVAETTDGDIIPLTTNNTEFVESEINKIDTKFDIGQADRNGEFLAWWVDRYNKAHAEVKKILADKINIEDTILQELSESIGFLFAQYQLPGSRYTHYADDNVDVTPYPYNNVIDEKLSFDTKLNIIELSNRTEAIFRRNISQVIPFADIAKTAHGSNLVTDHYHYERLKKNEPELNELMSDVLGNAYKILVWMGSNKLNNKQRNIAGVHEVVIENSKVNVDILMNKIQKLERPFNNDVLK